jgi:uncharacterized membrane protein
MEKYKIILYTSYIVCVISIVIFFIGFQNMPETVPIHQNIKGEVDDWGNKATLILLPSLSLIILIAISFLIKKPGMMNYPVEITEKNKKIMYSKMQLFMSLLSLFISSLFLVLIMESMNVFNLKYDLTFFIIYFIIFSLIPFLIIKSFRKL